MESCLTRFPYWFFNVLNGVLEISLKKMIYSTNCIIEASLQKYLLPTYNLLSIYIPLRNAKFLSASRFAYKCVQILAH